MLRILLENKGKKAWDDHSIPSHHKGEFRINVARLPTQPDTFLSPQLAQALKPHQIGGIRFMYDTVVESAAKFDSSSGMGCILAHSMGLGKTIQVIAFIDVLLKSTSAKHVLCVVPINTLQNWIAEFDMWIPCQPTIEQAFAKRQEQKAIEYRKFKVYAVNAECKTLALRGKEVLAWKETGGVMILGYEMYRMLALDTAKSSKGQDHSSDGSHHLHHNMFQALVDPGPDVVVCDEGHRIKNAKAGISFALKRIRTRRRIVLTGYPIQNNLMEYWCMVDFVRPNYLGSEKEFTIVFDKPIRSGNCRDALPDDRRLMRYRSHILTKLLSGFVQRRSEVILKQCLPTKLEHVFLVRLTDIQQRLLMALFDYLRVESPATRISPILLFSICNKIWNHPDIMYKIVTENGSPDDLDVDVDVASNGSSHARGTRKKKKLSVCRVRAMNAPPTGDLSVSASAAHQPSTSSSDAPLATLFSTPNIKDLDYSWAQPCFRGYVPDDLSTSGKMVLLFDLMDKIIRMKERLLVFSQSLLTLNLIEHFMSQQRVPGTSDLWRKGVNYYRLDGSTAGTDRERFIASFNRDTSFKVFLLSTKAGSLGINLIGASRIILFDASWNPVHDAQAACRIYRFGQMKQCFIYRFVADNSLEKKIYYRQVNKQGMSHRVVDELNPDVKVSYSQIVSLIEGLDRIDKEDQEQWPSSLSFSDPLVTRLCQDHKQYLTKQPFEHESLLLESEAGPLSLDEEYCAFSDYMRATTDMPRPLMPSA